MREIKFRAWHLGDKRWLPYFKVDPKGRVLITIDSGENLEWRYAKDEVILMQFTGLQDKNNRRIYEGDILKDTIGEIHKIEWHEGEARFLAVFKNPFGAWVNWRHIVDVKVMEVIGNVWENGELRKENK